MAGLKVPDFQRKSEIILIFAQLWGIACIANKRMVYMETSPFRAERVTILIAEDEESNYLLLKTILQKHANLLRARTGREVLEIFKQQPVDLILMDIKMPEMTGIEALKEVRRLSTNIPVIMQSAYVFDSDMEFARQAGASDFITKPINLKALKTTVSKYCPSVIW